MAETGVVLKTRRINLCKITSGAISTLPPITHIALGTGGVDAEGNPLIPSENQTALNNEVARYPIGAVTYPVETTASYTIDVPKDDLVGIKISEAALVDASGELCVVKNMYVKQKDEGVVFTFVIDDEF